MVQTPPTGIMLATQPDIHSSTWKIRPQRAHIYSRTHVSALIKYDLRVFLLLKPSGSLALQNSMCISMSLMLFHIQKKIF